MHLASNLLFLFCVLMLAGSEQSQVFGFFVKGNKKGVPRIGRSNDGVEDIGDLSSFVVRTLPVKNIPRMGRRNYDSEVSYDIPKFSDMPAFHIMEGQPPMHYEDVMSKEDLMEMMVNREENGTD